jgi:hypothetical protein
MSWHNSAFKSRKKHFAQKPCFHRFWCCHLSAQSLAATSSHLVIMDVDVFRYPPVSRQEMNNVHSGPRVCVRTMYVYCAYTCRLLASKESTHSFAAPKRFFYSSHVRSFMCLQFHLLARAQKVHSVQCTLGCLHNQFPGHLCATKRYIRHPCLYICMVILHRHRYRRYRSPSSLFCRAAASFYPSIHPCTDTLPAIIEEMSALFAGEGNEKIPMKLMKRLELNTTDRC